MIKFKEHDGKLFRMLEKPVPLTDDAELPVLVRMIQDDTMLGKANKRRSHPDTLAIKIICNELTDDGLFMDGNYAYRYEIIGYPVADGSADWALYQMMQGKKVCNPALAIEKAIRFGYNDVEQFNTFWHIVGDAVVEGKGNYGTLSISSWNAAASSTGWQIYEPKPEPLLAKAKVGDLCQRRDGKWVQIDRLLSIGGMPWICYEIGGLRYINNGEQLNSKLSELGIISTEPLAPEGTAEWAWQMLMLQKPVSHPAEGEFQDTYYIKEGFVRCMAKTGWQLYEPKPEPQYKAGDFVEIINWYSGTTHLRQIDSIDHEIHIGTHRFDTSGNSAMETLPQLNIIRKLKPSEVIINIGCLSGTIAKSCDPNYFLMLHSHPMTDCNHSMIRFSALDKQTRNLVESLLAQEEESND